MSAQRIFSRKKCVGVAWKVFKSKESQHGVRGGEKGSMGKVRKKGM